LHALQLSRLIAETVAFESRCHQEKENRKKKLFFYYKWGGGWLIKKVWIVYTVKQKQNTSIRVDGGDVKSVVIKQLKPPLKIQIKRKVTTEASTHQAKHIVKLQKDQKEVSKNDDKNISNVGINPKKMIKTYRMFKSL